MRHPDEGTIHAWLDGALDDAETAWIESHTRECPACGALVAEARGLVAGASRVLGALDAVPGGVVPARHEPVGTGSSGEVTAGRVIRRYASRTNVVQRPRWMAPARAAALLLVAGGAAVVMRSTDVPRLEMSDAVRGDTESVIAVPATPGATPGATHGATHGATPGATMGAAASAAPVGPAMPPAAVEERRALATLDDGGQPAPAQRTVVAPAPRTAAQATPGARPEHNDRRVEEKLLRVAESVIGRPRARALTAPLAMRPTPDSLAVPPTDVVVVGTVRDERTGEPVAGASILFDNGDIGTITDHLGRFTISGTTTGIHRAQVRRMGYASTEREVSVVGDSSVLDLRLAPSGTSIAAALGEGYTDVKRAPEKAVAGGSARETGEPSRRAGSARPGRPGSRTESAGATSVPQQSNGGTRPRDEVLDSVTLEQATSDNPGTTTARAVPPPLATRAPARVRRDVKRDAAGRCLSITLSPFGDRNLAPARTVVVRLLPVVRDAESTTGSAEFALEFPRAGDVASDARGGWQVVPRAGESAREATTVRLQWTAGDEEVRVDLDWAHAQPDGRASVRRGAVGVDARATATRLECRAVKRAP